MARNLNGIIGSPGRGGGLGTGVGGGLGLVLGLVSGVVSGVCSGAVSIMPIWKAGCRLVVGLEDIREVGC